MGCPYPAQSGLRANPQPTAVSRNQLLVTEQLKAKARKSWYKSFWHAFKGRMNIYIYLTTDHVVQWVSTRTFHVSDKLWSPTRSFGLVGLKRYAIGAQLLVLVQPTMYQKRKIKIIVRLILSLGEWPHLLDWSSTIVKGPKPTLFEVSFFINFWKIIYIPNVYVDHLIVCYVNKY